MAWWRAQFANDFFLRNEEQKLFSLYLGLLSHSFSFSCIFSPQISVIAFYNIRRVLSSVHIYMHTHSHFRDFQGSRLGKTTADAG